MPKATVSRRRLRDSAATRTIILRAAKRIFADAGLAGARIDAIAAAAGVNKAMIYYYFRSKEELYGVVLEDDVQEFRRRAEEILSRKEAPGVILLRYISNHFDFIGARPSYPRLIQQLIMTGDARMKQMVRKHSIPLLRRLTALIERGMRSGEFRSFSPPDTALSIVALTVFYFNAAPIIRMVGGFDVYDKARQAHRKQEVLKFIRYALFKNPEVGSR